MVLLPDLRGQPHELLAPVLVADEQRQRHHHAAVVAEADHGEELRRRPELAIGFGHRVEPAAIGAAILRRDVELVEAVVEVLEFGKALGAAFDARIALHADARRAAVAVGLAEGLVEIGILGDETEGGHLLDAHVDVLGRVEPAAPEPVEVDAARVLHGAEEVRRHRPLERPAPAVLPEREVEELAAHHRLAQDVERRGRLRVGVVAELDDALGVGHDRPLVLADHERHDRLRLSAAAGPAFVPAPLREPLHEGVEALVHPRPLALVAVDDHREPEVPDLVDDHLDEALLRALAPRAVLLRARPVEGDHRVLHAADGAVDGDRGGVGIGVGDVAVDLDAVGDRLRGVLRPQRLGGARPEAHAHRRTFAGLGIVASRHRDAEGVPDELRARGPGEVAHVLGGEAPRAAAAGAGVPEFAIAGLVGEGLLGRDDVDRTIRVASLREPFALRHGQHFVGVLEFAGRRDDVGLRHVDRDLVVAELERELAAAEELLVLPAGRVGVGAHAREPLGDEVERVPVLGEPLVEAASAALPLLAHRVVPPDRELDRLSRPERLGQVDPHHRADDRVRQRIARGVVDRFDGDAAGPVPVGVELAQEADALLLPQVGPRIGKQRLRTLGVAVGLELHPEIGERVGALVGVDDLLEALDAMALVVEPHLDAMVGAVLPVLRSWCARCGAEGVRRRQDLLELPELVGLRELLDRKPRLVVKLVAIGERRVRRDRGGKQAQHGDRGERMDSVHAARIAVGVRRMNLLVLRKPRNAEDHGGLAVKGQWSRRGARGSRRCGMQPAIERPDGRSPTSRSGEQALLICSVVPPKIRRASGSTPS